jgi:hypothetical protein
MLYQVMNFYELRKHSHLRTVPIMEELEGVVFLNRKHSQQLLAHTDLDLSQQKSAHVVVAAGEAGTLKLFVVGMKVRCFGWNAHIQHVTALLCCMPP